MRDEKLEEALDKKLNGLRKKFYLTGLIEGNFQYSKQLYEFGADKGSQLHEIRPKKGAVLYKSDGMIIRNGGKFTRPHMPTQFFNSRHLK